MTLIRPIVFVPPQSRPLRLGRRLPSTGPLGLAALLTLLAFGLARPALASDFDPAPGLVSLSDGALGWGVENLRSLPAELPSFVLSPRFQPIDDAQVTARFVYDQPVIEGKAALAVGVTDDLTARISAVDLVRVGAGALGGKGGGGRPDMAQAGGPDGKNADEALEAIIKQIEIAASK